MNIINDLNSHIRSGKASDRALAKATGQTIKALNSDTTIGDPSLETAFAAYQKHGGELPFAEFQILPDVRARDGHLGTAMRILMQHGLPDPEIWQQCAKLVARYPNKHEMWYVAESYLTLGRF